MSLVNSAVLGPAGNGPKLEIAMKELLLAATQQRKV